MGKSARLLGQENGLTPQEMNYILKKEGFLKGDVGGYTVTEKGIPYVEDKDYHRGTGGYAHYNRNWTTRTWDDSIQSELHITNDMKREARDAVTASRRQHLDEIKAARAEADAAFLKRYNQNDNDNDDDNDIDNDDDNLSDSSSEDNSELLGARLGLIIGGLLVLGYGVYKAVPHVVKWWKGSVAPKFSGTKNISINKVAKKMICPSCRGKMKINDCTAIWKCVKCNYSISK